MWIHIQRHKRQRNTICKLLGFYQSYYQVETLPSLTSSVMWVGMLVTSTTPNCDRRLRRRKIYIYNYTHKKNANRGLKMKERHYSIHVQEFHLPTTQPLLVGGFHDHRVPQYVRSCNKSDREQLKPESSRFLSVDHTQLLTPIITSVYLLYNLGAARGKCPCKFLATGA